jgi:hypothetical protein
MNGEFDKGLTPDLSPENPLYTLNNKMPAVTNVVYIIIFGFFTSLCAGMATVLSWCFPDIKYTYPLSFCYLVFANFRTELFISNDHPTF